MDVSSRLFVQEQMDDFSITDDRLTLALEQLPTLNRLLGTYRVIKNCLGPVLFQSRKNHAVPISSRAQDLVTILDVGSGIGDIPIMIAKWSDSTARNVRIVASDGNSFTSEYAREAAQKRLPPSVLDRITFTVADAFALPFADNSFDYVLATQLLHHFTHDEATRCVKEMQRVSRFGLLVNDLHRHAFAYRSIKVIVKALSMSSMIVNDAPISVHRGFVRKELDAIAQSSGLTNHRVRWHLPFRWSLSTLRRQSADLH